MPLVPQIRELADAWRASCRTVIHWEEGSKEHTCDIDHCRCRQRDADSHAGLGPEQTQS